MQRSPNPAPSSQDPGRPHPRRSAVSARVPAKNGLSRRGRLGKRGTRRADVTAPRKGIFHRPAPRARRRCPDRGGCAAERGARNPRARGIPARPAGLDARRSGKSRGWGSVAAGRPTFPPRTQAELEQPRPRAPVQPLLSRDQRSAYCTPGPRIPDPSSPTPPGLRTPDSRRSSARSTSKQRARALSGPRTWCSSSVPSKVQPQPVTLQVQS